MFDLFTMITQFQMERAEQLLHGAFEGHIKDELRYMVENDEEEIFSNLCEDDFILDISVKVSDASASVLVSWSSLLKSMAEQDYAAFREFENYHLVDGLDSDPYQRLIEIHSIVDDTNGLFSDALVQAALAVAGAEKDANQYEIDFTSEGAIVFS